MFESKKKPVSTPFPSIKPEMLGRLEHEADLRTMRPQDVDWEEIHRMAAAARE